MQNFTTVSPGSGKDESKIVVERAELERPRRDFLNVKARTYTPREKADALARLAACRGCVKEAARQAGVPRKTLEGRRAGRGITPEVLMMTEESKSELADKFLAETNGALDEAVARRQNASYRDLMIGSAWPWTRRICSPPGRRRPSRKPFR